MKNSNGANLFFEWCKKNIIWILIILLVTIVLAANFIFQGDKIINNPSLGLGGSENPVASGAIPSTLYGSGIPQTSGVIYPSGSFSPPKNLQDVAKIISLINPSNAPIFQNQILPLPEVLDSELNINSSGAYTLNDYLNSLAKSFADSPSFLSKTNLSEMLKDQHNTPLLPLELIEKSLAGGEKSQIKKSLLAWKDLNNDFVSRYKRVSIKNSSAMLNVVKTTTGFSKLYGNLIDKGIAFTDDQVGQEEARAYFNKFIETKNFYSNQLKKQLNDLAEGNNLWIKTAQAQSAIPLGGTIIETEACCNGMKFKITPVTPSLPGPFLATWAFLASPFNFREFHNLTVAAWILGTYTPGDVCILTESDCEDEEPVTGTLYPGSDVAGTSK